MLSVSQLTAGRRERWLWNKWGAFLGLVCHYLTILRFVYLCQLAGQFVWPIGQRQEGCSLSHLHSELQSDCRRIKSAEAIRRKTRLKEGQKSWTEVLFLSKIMVKCLIQIKTKVNVHLRMINHCYREVKVRVLSMGPRLLGKALGVLPLFPALPGGSSTSGFGSGSGHNSKSPSRLAVPPAFHGYSQPQSNIAGKNPAGCVFCGLYFFWWKTISVIDLIM